MSSVFNPGREADTNETGQILYDAGELKNIEVFRDEDFRQDSVARSEILDFGDQGFLLHSLLTPRECQHYIEKGEEVGFEPIIGVKNEVRSSERIALRNQELSALLWERVAPFLSEVNISGNIAQHHVHGVEFLLQGAWQPYGLNDVFRLCRYLPSGHFSPHFDGHFDRSSDDRSLKTLMLYLNGNFTGGSTNFVDEKQTLYKDESGKFCAEEKNILCRIQPEQGMAIVFNHHRLHEGAKLGTGKKYILRTDVMFRNTNRDKLSADDEKAVLMVQEAERKEACGDCMEAAELYKKAFKLSPAVAKAYGS